MTWTVTNLLVEIIAGIVAGYFAGLVHSDYSLGSVGNCVVGAIGGGLSGYFLQTMIATTVTANGSLSDPTLPEQIAVNTLGGAVAGAISVLAVGFLKHAADTHSKSKL